MIYNKKINNRKYHQLNMHSLYCYNNYLIYIYLKLVLIVLIKHFTIYLHAGDLWTVSVTLKMPLLVGEIGLFKHFQKWWNKSSNLFVKDNCFPITDEIFTFKENNNSRTFKSKTNMLTAKILLI